MAKQRFLNNFTSTFIAAVKDAPSSGTPETELDYGVLRISDGAAGSLINPTDGDYYLLTAFKRSGSSESNIEVMRVTSVNNATPGECRITVQRAQEGTSAKAFVSGDYLSLRITRGTAENFAQPADMAQKVDKVAGKGLSTEDYTTAEKTKLAGVAAGAQVNTVTSVSGKTGAVTLAKGDVGLGNVDNTSDANKPVSTAQQAALNGKENTGTAAAAVAAHTAASDPHPQYQVDLVSGTNIKTINGQSILGAGNIEIQGGIGPTLQGDTAPYVTQTKTYQITNYNSFSSYTASASAGTASLVGDTITYTAPGTPGSVSLTITVDGQPAVFTVAVQAACVAPPTNTSPADGATNIGAAPTLQ